MLKTVNLQIDSNSWISPKTVPPALAAPGVSGSRNVEVLSALLMTALLTRPPVSHGFELSDLWAWMRYGPAIADASDLRLRAEWNSIDPHQKTILSDDFGMGFTAHVLSDLLDFRHFADTKYVLGVIDPTSSFSWFRQTPKRGPAKAPDFLVLDGANRLNVLECKGSQASDDAIIHSIENPGAMQKNNLNLSRTVLNECLVAGLFVPQYLNPNSSTLRIRDPYPEKFLRRLEDVSSDDLKLCVIQIGLAKHFALLGLDVIASALTDSQLLYKNKLEMPEEEELKAIEALGQKDIEFRFTVPFPHSSSRVGEHKIRKAVFHGSCHSELYMRVARAQDIQRALISIGQLLPDNLWLKKEAELGASVVTPLGFTLSLSYDSEPIGSAYDSRNWLQVT